ncbi:MAG: hypothetical protein ACRCX8_02895 [Sarcina sp.]
MMALNTVKHMNIKEANFDRVYADNKETIYNVDDRIFFTVYRVNNDVNGNPLYKIIIEDKEGNNINHLYKEKAYRTYSKGYSLLQTYNLSNKLENLFN